MTDNDYILPPYANVLECGLDQLILVVAQEWDADIDDVEEAVSDLMMERCGWVDGEDE